MKEDIKNQVTPEYRASKVCAIIITFNRHELLSRCLEAISGQTTPPDDILIIDNASTDGTFEHLKKCGWLKNGNTHYIAISENIGGAGGFHEGMKYASKNFPGSWMWLMDDDGYPSQTCLELLHEQANSRNLDAIAPLQIDITNKKLIAFPIFGEKYPKDNRVETITKADFLEGTANLFNGLLITPKAVGIVGYPRKELFIRGDEVDYTKRIKRNRLNFGTLTSAHFFHPSDRDERIRIFFKTTTIRDAHSDFKNYYLFRNRARAFCEDRNSWLIPLDFLRYIFYFLITKKMDFHGLSLWIKATADGILGKLGKIY